jgi:hypothetical protein
MMKAARDEPDYYVVHNYFTPWEMNSSATDILNDALTIPARQMSYVLQCLHDNSAKIKPIAMDEWNMFAVGNKQQVSNTSGLFAVLVLGEAMRNKYGLAARWDLLNGWAEGNDHGIFSAGDEPGVERWSPRPSFYYLYYLQRCLGDRLVSANVTGDSSLRAYASTFSSGEIGAALVNIGPKATTTTLNIDHFTPAKRYYWYTLQGGDDNGDFSARVEVNGKSSKGPAGGPEDYATLKANAASPAHGIRVTVPAHGVVFLVVPKQ